MSPGELLTFTDVCEHLGITIHTLKKAVRLGQSPTVLIGDREYVTRPHWSDVWPRTDRLPHKEDKKRRGPIRERTDPDEEDPN
jgi:hypothetical protein